MLQKNTLLHIMDNSTPVSAKCIHLYTRRKFASIGDIVLLAVKSSNRPRKQSKKIKYIEKGSVIKGMVTHVKKKVKRFDGSFISFLGNTCVLLNNQHNFIGTRILGPTTIELLKNATTKKILTISPLVL